MIWRGSQFNPASKGASVKGSLFLISKSNSVNVSCNKDFGFWILEPYVAILLVQILDFGFVILDFGLWILDFGFRILDFGFRILDFGFWILDFGFWILDFGLGAFSRTFFGCFIL